ncbi:hypothetical protein [Comamonas sp. lk]|uniref:hypothetical protein n=1 Tax=Comamonas sp. lk TaxID=2201272 RepID=UPI000EB15DB8|nr:hypothetical protein [Comamonas sp. lk]
MQDKTQEKSSICTATVSQEGPAKWNVAFEWKDGAFCVPGEYKLYAHPQQAAPAAVAVPDERAEFEDFFRKRNGLHPDTDTTFRSDAAEPWRYWQARAALAATTATELATLPAAAPVLPEPDAMEFQGNDGEWHGFVDARHKQATVESGKWPIRNLYSEGSVRALLATATGLPAQSVPARLITAINTACGGNEWQGDALVTDLLEPACRAIASFAPQAQADARDADDAALIEWLSGQYLAADFHWGDPKTSVLVIEIPPTASVCGDFRTDVRAAIAIAAAKGE